MGETANEIQEVMGRSYGMPEVDEADLEAELEALGDDMMADNDATYLDEAISAPSAPTGVPGSESVNDVSSSPGDRVEWMEGGRAMDVSGVRERVCV